MAIKKVLIVDDSALMREVLEKILSGHPQLEVVGTARDPYDAREKVKRLLPDVLTLDVEMPKMDGLTFLGHLMRGRPTPTVVLSSLTTKSSELAFKALDLCAIEVLCKPQMDMEHGMEEYADKLRDVVFAASNVSRSQLVASFERKSKQRADRESGSDAPVKPSTRDFKMRTTHQVIAIGSSTGGTQALPEVLAALPPTVPGIVIAQHIPPGFSTTFAERLNADTPFTVREAQGGERILPGRIFVAPGDRHLRIRRTGAQYCCEVIDTEKVNHHRPSVDVLFRSVAEAAGPNSIGVILTGMGDDGAAGLLGLKELGNPTIAQDERTSVVWGMPGSAVALGAAAEVLPLNEIAGAIEKAARQRAVAPTP